MNTNVNNKHQVRTKLITMFQKDLDLSEIEAQDLEIGIFNSSIDYANSLKITTSWSCELFAETYIKNEKLIDRLKQREFLPHKLPYMSAVEVFPEVWKDLMEKHQRKIKGAYEIKQVSMAEDIKCGKCKKNKVTYYELQTRSGDEAITQYFSCICCGHKWKY